MAVAKARRVLSLQVLMPVAFGIVLCPIIASCYDTIALAAAVGVYTRDCSGPAAAQFTRRLELVAPGFESRLQQVQSALLDEEPCETTSERPPGDSNSLHDGAATSSGVLARQGAGQAPGLSARYCEGRKDFDAASSAATAASSEDPRHCDDNTWESARWGSSETESYNVANRYADEVETVRHRAKPLLSTYKGEPNGTHGRETAEPTAARSADENAGRGLLTEEVPKCITNDAGRCISWTSEKPRYEMNDPPYFGRRNQTDRIEELRTKGTVNPALVSRLRALLPSSSDSEDEGDNAVALLLLLLGSRVPDLEAQALGYDLIRGDGGIESNRVDATQELLTLSTISDLLRTGARGTACIIKTIQQLTVPLAGPPNVCRCFDSGSESVVCSGLNLVKILVVNLMGITSNEPKVSETKWIGVPRFAQRLWLNGALPSSISTPLKWSDVQDEAATYAVLWQSVVEAWEVQAVPFERCGAQLFPAWSCKLILTAPVEIGASPPLGLVLVRDSSPANSLESEARQVDVLISFRGTRTAGEAKADFRFDMKPIPEIDPKMAVHSGFYSVASAYTNPIGDFLLKLASNTSTQIGTITITGHSLGGGLAQVLPIVLRTKRADIVELLDKTPLRVVTFGSPRTGNRAFVNYLNSKALVRSLVAEYDPVPDLPCNGLTQCMQPPDIRRYGPYADAPGKIEVPLGALPATWRLRSAWSWHSCSYPCFLSMMLTTSQPYQCGELACELNIWT